MDTTIQKSSSGINYFKTIKVQTFLLAFLTFIAYIPAIRAGFIWDDEVITSQQGWFGTLEGLWKIWTQPIGHYWPMFYTSFWLEYPLWGNLAMGYHLTNILIHAVNTILIWTILQR